MPSGPHSRRWIGSVGLVALLSGFLPIARADETDSHPALPVALAWGPGERLLVAAREARAVIVVDPASRSVVSRWSLGFRPASLSTSDDGAIYVGGHDGELAVLDGEGRLRRMVAAGRGPTRVIAMGEGRV